LGVVVVVTLAATSRGEADSFLGTAAPVDPAIELTIHDLFRTSSPIDHLGILEANYGGNPRFFEHHLAADPDNDLRVLDAAIAHAHARTTKSAKRSRVLLVELAARTSDPRTKLVAGLVLAAAESTIGGSDSWARETEDKRLVVAWIAFACASHVEAPLPGVGELVGGFVSYARNYDGYAALLEPLAACGAVKAPEETREGMVVHSTYRNGQTELEMEWRGGKRNGVSRRYYEDGTLESETRWKDNRREGPERRYYPSGALAAELANEQGWQDGPAVYYHPNGKKSREGTYRDGREVGVWRTYDKTGALVEEKDKGN
jgi:hypothetical protein